MNKTIKQIISSFVDPPLHQEWDQVLPFAVHAYNTSVQTSTRVKPFRDLDGCDPNLPPDLRTLKITPTKVDAAEWWLYLQQQPPLLRQAILKNLNVA